MSNILIIGANRGLGLEFVKQYSNTNHNIIATTRNKNSSKELSEINNIDIAELDLTCLLYTSPSPRDISGSRMPSSA